jgi:protein O-GlcNAc transferase
MASVHADSQKTKGNQSPAVKAGGNVMINYGLSKEEVDNIVAVYTKQHQLDTEQIKALTTAITALSQGKGVAGTASQIKAAIAALKQGQVTQAKALFIQETQRVELAAKQGAEAYRNLGALAFLDNTQEALQAYRRATQLDPGNADGWNNLGHLLLRVGELDEAMAAYNTVLALGERHGDKVEIAAAYGNLGLVYKTRGELDKAIEFQQKALKLNEALGRKEGMADDYVNLGNVHLTRGELDKAVEFYQKALKLMEELGSKEGMAILYGNLGIVYEQRGDLDKAIEFHQKALKLNESLGRKQGMANAYGNLGNVYSGPQFSDNHLRW